MKTRLALFSPLVQSAVALASAFALGGSAFAQQPKPALPIGPNALDTPPELPKAAASAPLAPLAPAAPVTTTMSAAPLTRGAGAIMLNFQGASLNDVLNYLSEAAGFVVVQETPVTGTVNVMSRQSVNADEAVDLLNAVLVEKGFIAIRNGRILKIVKRDGAQKRDLPVQTGSDPERIPRKDEMVTQILPLRFGEAAKLVENLRPLLADNATINANEGSNSILLTDTQTNIRRIAQIIQAIDTSVASISTIHVYPLQYANAKELATVVTQLFTSTTTSTTPNQSFGGRRRGGGGFGPPGFDGGGAAPTSAQSEARQANSRVVAVADDQSNALIVSAPEDLLPTISEIVTKIDTSTTDATTTRIFQLLHADAVETADIINSLYGDAASQLSKARSQTTQSGRNAGNYPAVPVQSVAAASGQQSERALMQARVVAVGDGRTNSLLVNTGRDTMNEIAEMVGRLDASDSKKQHVYVHSLEHADADTVANVLRGMLGDQTATQTTENAASRLSTRSAQGASMDTSEFSNTNSGSGRSSR